MRTYHALRFGIVYITEDRHTWTLDPRLDVRNHSPTGFSWGYNGSGPAQLALAILVDHFGRHAGAQTLHVTKDTIDKAVARYQQFKFRVIAPLDRDGPFELTTEQIDAALTDIEPEHA